MRAEWLGNSMDTQCRRIVELSNRGKNVPDHRGTEHVALVHALLLPLNG